MPVENTWSWKQGSPWAFKEVRLGLLKTPGHPGITGNFRGVEKQKGGGNEKLWYSSTEIVLSLAVIIGNAKGPSVGDIDRVAL